MTTPDPLRAALEGLEEDLASADHGSVEDGPAFARGGRWVIEKVRALLAVDTAPLHDCDWVYAPMLGFYCMTHKATSMTEPPTHPPVAVRPAKERP